MSKQYRSRIMAAINETVEDLRAAGVIDEDTMRSFDATRATSTRSRKGRADGGADNGEPTSLPDLPRAPFKPR